MTLRLEGGLELDTALFELRRGGDRVPLEPQSFDVLCYLVAHRDRVVPKEELMDTVWGGRFVSETAVTSRIKQVRRALGDDGRTQRYVRTHHGRGYHFVGRVEEAGEDRPPPVRYTVSDGLHIAYQVTSAVPADRVAGATDIVLISGFVSHLELDWGDPRHAHFLHRISNMGRLIRFDKRGTGMSDRPAGVPDLETRMHDVLAVMDAAGSERAVLFGYSEGGPMAVLMAAMHPERVSALVLYASYARRTRTPDYPWAQTRVERAAYAERLVTAWDWESDLLTRSPSGDEAMQRWWALRMRAAATPSTVRALFKMNDLIDVRDVLPSVRVPTLVIHRRGDPLVKAEEAAYLAERIPGARLVLMDGVDHLPVYGADEVLDPVEPFVAEVSHDHDQPVMLAAVVAVGGPGDQVSQVVDSLVGWGGRPRLAGDRRVVLFDGPATAVRAARRAARGQASVGITIAEVARDGEAAQGPGVDAALRLADAGTPGGLAVSEAAASLLAGSPDAASAVAPGVTA